MRPCPKTTFLFWSLHWLMLFKGLKKELHLENLGDSSCSPQSSACLYCVYLCRICQVLWPGHSFLGSPAWVELPWTGFLGQEKEPGLERQLFWARCSHCVISSVQVKLHPEKCMPDQSGKNNNKQGALRVKPGEQGPGEP